MKLQNLLTQLSCMLSTSLLSGLNNLSVYPITKSSSFDTDFTLTENEFM